jgi:hypothetical protein
MLVSKPNRRLLYNTLPLLSFGISRKDPEGSCLNQPPKYTESEHLSPLGLNWLFAFLDLECSPDVRLDGAIFFSQKYRRS